jgi:hypothetical protein
MKYNLRVSRLQTIHIFTSVEAEAFSFLKQSPKVSQPMTHLRAALNPCKHGKTLN